MALKQVPAQTPCAGLYVKPAGPHAPSPAALVGNTVHGATPKASYEPICSI
jgi:hypothetical protein